MPRKRVTSVNPYGAGRFDRVSTEWSKDGICIVKMMSSVLLLLSILAAVGGCDSQSRGFKLPAGNSEVGKETFVSLGCNDCHSVADIEHVTITGTDLNLRLGGAVSRVKTYGELLTSIINPSHKIAQPYPQQAVEIDGKSVMRDYNSVMTVQQLVDLVTFLETAYDLRVPPSYL